MNPLLRQLRNRITRDYRLLKEYCQGMRAAPSRRALTAADDALMPVRFTGQEFVGRVLPGLGGDDVAARNLFLVTDVLDALEVPYFLVPGESRARYVLGVDAGERTRVLRTLREHHQGDAVFIGFPSGVANILNPVLLSDPSLPTELSKARTLRVGQLVLGPAGQVLYGPEVACDVEFWRDGAEILSADDGEAALTQIRSQDSEEVLRGSLVGPRANRIADVLPESEQKPAWVTVGKKEIPTFETLTHTTAEDVRSPIDVVYTWVDGDDPKLREKRNRFLSVEEMRIAEHEYGESRYTSRDELKYSLRSLWMYAPFVRNVYIVTDGQTPAWLDTSQDRVRVVDHRDIFPEGVLPVFNSHAIETRLHHIPGLSEHYLYLNDDVFFGRPVTPQHFFFGDRITRVPVSPFKVGIGEPRADEPAPNSAGKNVRALLAKTHGRATVNKFKHVPHPFRRSAVFVAEDTYRDAFATTTRSRFRSTSDIQPASLIHQNEMFSGGAVPAHYDMTYIDIAKPRAAFLLGELRKKRDRDFFCVNDVDSPVEKAEEYRRMITCFLQEYFPFPSPWELGVSGGARGVVSDLLAATHVGAARGERRGSRAARP